MASSTVNAIEYRYDYGTSDKYWRIFEVTDGSIRMIATHYGRVGTDGSITVHHNPLYSKSYDLRISKERKGYDHIQQVSFTIPTTLLQTASSTNATGNGGTNAGAARALVAYYHAARQAVNLPNIIRDPAATLIGNEVDAYVAGLAAHANIPMKEALGMELESLEGLAGLMSISALV